MFADWGGGNYERVRRVDPGILKFNFNGKSGYKDNFAWKAPALLSEADV